MSYLSRPQIHFGGVAYCNPPTGNNNDLANIFDVDTLEFAPVMSVIDKAIVQDPPNQQTFPYQDSSSASDCRNWLMGLMNNVSDGGPYGQQVHWNYYGNHATRLDDTKVRNIVCRPGVSVAADDPLMNATVQLIGTPSPMQFQDPVIVDNDPYALITSQIFSHGIQVTAKHAGGATTALISANPTSRSYAYYINPSKNLDPNAIGFQMVSAVFDLAVPSGPNLKINTNVNSSALNDLAAAVAEGAGLMMRFCYYDAIYHISPDDLHSSFAAGKYIANPYIGLNLGSIGVLAKGDMLSAPPGRKLSVQVPVKYNLAAPCGTSKTGANSGSANLGITLANVDTTAQVVTLDCISTFPECNVTTNAKYDFGEMTLDLVGSDGSRIVLGSIPYTDQNAYQNNGGIVEIPLANNPQRGQIEQALTTGKLAIHSVALNQDVLLESPGLDIETDDRALYFDEKTISNWNDPTEAPIPGTSAIKLRVFQQGVPVQSSVTVNLEHWMCDKSQINPSKPQVNAPSRYFTVAGAVPQNPTIYPNPNYDAKNPQSPKTIPVITDQVTIPGNSNGTLTINLSALRPGTSILRFVDPSISQVTPNFAWDNCNYACVRILPFDDYRSVPDSQVGQWSYIYANFFNYFALLYPIMSTVIPWGPENAPDNPNMVKQFATNMRTFTNPAIWDTTIYMPIARELSAGKRALLYRWCALQGA